MCRHAGFWWGGAGGTGTHSRLGSSRWQSWRAALWAVQFVLCFLLFCIVVVPVPSVCCSVKLPLSQPTSFCLFLSVLPRKPAGGGAAAWRFCCRRQPNYNRGSAGGSAGFSQAMQQYSNRNTGSSQIKSICDIEELFSVPALNSPNCRAELRGFIFVSPSSTCPTTPEEWF